jgi:4-azaleucine resistance transporter AzlC
MYMSEHAAVFSRRGILSGSRASLPIAASVAAVGLAFGVLARQSGLTFPETVLMSAIVFAGASQFVALGLWAGTLPVIPIILTTLVVNLRHTLMGATLQPWFRSMRRSRAYLSVFFMVDESWALTVQRVAAGESDRAFLMGAGLTLYVSWVASTAIGRAVGAALTHPERFGLDFAITAVFVALLAGLWKSRSDALPWLCAGAASLVAAKTLAGTWYILIGAIAGTVVGGLRDDR